MTTKVGIRDLARNSNILDGKDYVEVEALDILACKFNIIN